MEFLAGFAIGMVFIWFLFLILTPEFRHLIYFIIARKTIFKNQIKTRRCVYTYYSTQEVPRSGSISIYDRDDYSGNAISISGWGSKSDKFYFRRAVKYFP